LLLLLLRRLRQRGGIEKVLDVFAKYKLSRIDGGAQALVLSLKSPLLGLELLDALLQALDGLGVSVAQELDSKQEVVMRIGARTRAGSFFGQCGVRSRENRRQQALLCFAELLESLLECTALLFELGQLVLSMRD